MPFSRKLIIGFIVGFSLLTTMAHLWIFQQDPTHVVLEELYYIPILLGALFFGLKGALIPVSWFHCFICLTCSAPGPVVF